MTMILILAIALILLAHQKGSAAPRPTDGSKIATVNDVIDSTIASTQRIVGAIRGVIDYGTSQGMSESEITQIDPSESTAANPDSAKTAKASSRAVRSGPTSISALRAMPTTIKTPRNRPMPIKTRTQSRAIVPYSPYARTSSVDRIKMLMNS